MLNKIEFFQTPYENYYASKDGEIFSVISKKCLSPKIDKDGYEEYTLTINGSIKYLRGHRIIAETFLSNPDNKPTVNHKNGIKNDNRVENLEWNTYSENNQHRFAVLHCYKPMKYIISYLYQGVRYTGFSLKDCEKAGISSTYLKNIINGTINKYFMYFEKTESNSIKVFWNGKVYKEYKTAKEAAQDLGMKLNCLYIRAKRHKDLEYITRDYEFFYEINNNNNNESVTTKEIASSNLRGIQWKSVSVAQDTMTEERKTPEWRDSLTTTDRNIDRGLQSINALDFCLAPYVHKSFIKALRKNIHIYTDVLDTIYSFNDNADKDLSCIRYEDKENKKEEWAHRLSLLFDNMPENIAQKIYNQACDDVEEETKQAMEAMIHNFNTLHSRAGKICVPANHSNMI